MGFFTKSREIKKDRENFENSIDYLKKVFVTHVNGLPLGKDPCTLYLCKDKLFIKSSNCNFTIQIDKIISTSSSIEREIKQEIKGSVGKAIVGGALFGTTGAIVAGMPKSKEKKGVVINNLLINYINKDNEVDKIEFMVHLGKDINEFSDVINNLIGKENIEL